MADSNTETAPSEQRNLADKNASMEKTSPSESLTACDWANPKKCHIPGPKMMKDDMVRYNNRYWPIPALRLLVCCGINHRYFPWDIAFVLTQQYPDQLGDLSEEHIGPTLAELARANSRGYQALVVDISRESDNVRRILEPMPKLVSRSKIERMQGLRPGDFLAYLL